MCTGSKQVEMLGSRLAILATGDVLGEEDETRGSAED